MMKRRIIALFLAVFTLCAMMASSHATVSAQSTFTGPYDEICRKAAQANPAKLPSVCKENAAYKGENPITGVNGILLRVVSLLSYGVGVASTIMVIVGGLKYITANGDSSAINSAKNTVVYSFVGIIVAIVSQALIYFVVKRLT